MSSDPVMWLAFLAIGLVVVCGVTVVLWLAARDVRKARREGRSLNTLGGDNSNATWGGSGPSTPGPL